MIDLDDVMRKAESELVASETLMRATKTGIIFGVLAASLRKYSKVPVSNDEALRLMEILARDGRLFETLPVSDFTQTSPPLTVHDDSIPQGVAPPSLSQEEQRARDEDIRIMRARGFREEEIQAILALGGLNIEGGEVEQRSDEELARYEQEKRNPFPGTPRGTPVDGYTMTDPEDLPDDLKSAMS